MRKIVSALVSLSLLVPLLALAQAPTSCTLSHDVGVTGCPTSGTCNFNTNNQCGLCCVLDAVMTASDWIFAALLLIVALFVIWGGFTIATAGGSPEKVSSGRNSILYALIGLAVALLSKAFPALIRALIQ